MEFIKVVYTRQFVIKRNRKKRDSKLNRENTDNIEFLPARQTKVWCVRKSASNSKSLFFIL